MDLIERLEWLTLGCVIGFILGYIVGRLRDIRAEVHEIKEELNIVETDVKHIRDDQGVMTHRWSANIALALVVSLTFFAAIQSQRASNRSNETSKSVIALQTEQKQNLDCTTQVLFDVVSAVNGRTAYAGAQADANIDLIQGQLDFLTSLSVQPPLTDEEKLENYFAYVHKVEDFLAVAKKTRQQQYQNPYPTVEDLTACLAQLPENTKEPKQ